MQITRKRKELRTLTVTDQTEQPQQLAGHRSKAQRAPVVPLCCLCQAQPDTEKRIANFRTPCAAVLPVAVPQHIMLQVRLLVCALPCRQEQRRGKKKQITKNKPRSHHNTAQPKFHSDSAPTSERMLFFKERSESCYSKNEGLREGRLVRQVFGVVRIRRTTRNRGQTPDKPAATDAKDQSGSAHAQV